MSGNLQHNGLYVSQNLTQNYASLLSNVDRYQQNNMFNDPGLVAVYGSLCAENAVLRERMAQDNLKEEAYRQTGDNGNEVYTFGKNGQPILLLNRKVVRADRVFPDKLCRSEAYYVIEFLNVEQPLICYRVIINMILDWSKRCRTIQGWNCICAVRGRQQRCCYGIILQKFYKTSLRFIMRDGSVLERDGSSLYFKFFNPSRRKRTSNMGFFGGGSRAWLDSKTGCGERDCVVLGAAK